MKKNLALAFILIAAGLTSASAQELDISETIKSARAKVEKQKENIKAEQEKLASKNEKAISNLVAACGGDFKLDIGEQLVIVKDNVFSPNSISVLVTRTTGSNWVKITDQNAIAAKLELIAKNITSTLTGVTLLSTETHAQKLGFGAFSHRCRPLK